MNPVQPITLKDRQAARLEQQLAKVAQERGLTPMPLETDILLRRVSCLDWSGEFLGDAFISVYWRNRNFNHSLFQLINLDAEGFRLFHQILHVRFIKGWSDDQLHALMLQINEILIRGRGDVSATDE